jgi:cytochrome P450
METAEQTSAPDQGAARSAEGCRLFDRVTIYENPYETIIPRIHEGPSVFRADNAFPGPSPGWVIRRAEDLRTIYADTENFYKQGNTQFAQMIGETWDAIPTELDPPRHTGFRTALNPIFSPRNMAALDGRVRERARFFIDKFKSQGGCEFVADFAVPFPVTIFLELLGLPQAEMEQFLFWEGQILHGNDRSARATSVRAVKAYLLAAIEERRRNPRDDLISNALTLEVDGRKWTSEEVFGHCFNLYIGGLDTVTSNMGLHFHHLATHPDQQEDLRANPNRAVVAIEELLRGYAAVTTARICRNPYSIGGVTFMPGDYIAMSTPLGGRDPEEFESPNEIRLDRKPAHLTLGYGIHRCLGQHLARRELQIAMQEFLATVPSFRIKAGFNVPFYVGNIVHVEELPLVW